MRSAHVRTTMTRALGCTGAACILALASGCTSSSKTTGGGHPASGGTAQSGGPAGSVAADTVDVKNFTFTPTTLTVAVGAKVTWKFDDAAQHTVVASDGSFKSSALNNGQMYTFTFAKAGTYDYICSIHQYMKGKVVVK